VVFVYSGIISPCALCYQAGMNEIDSNGRPISFMPRVKCRFSMNIKIFSRTVIHLHIPTIEKSQANYWVELARLIETGVFNKKARNTLPTSKYDIVL
jgi:hypothetical protein